MPGLWPVFLVLISLTSSWRCPQAALTSHQSSLDTFNASPISHLQSSGVFIASVLTCSDIGNNPSVTFAVLLVLLVRYHLFTPLALTGFVVSLILPGLHSVCFPAFSTDLILRSMQISASYALWRYLIHYRLSGFCAIDDFFWLLSFFAGGLILPGLPSCRDSW